ncbi:hypothetical protein K2X30_05405 [bacterium]|nr:hypothetical protein [bacterium]
MFSKNVFVAGIAASALMIGTSGCFLKFKEEAKPEKAIQLVNPEDQDCLEKAPAVLQEYFEGTLESASKIERLFKCASNSLELFYKYTQGEREGIYSPNELRKFFQRYFLGEVKISDSLLREIMGLKQTILGGADDVVTTAELQRIKELMEVLRVHAVRLYPYMPVTPEHLKTMPEEQLNAAIAEMLAGAKSMGGTIESVGYPYSFERFEKLLTEVAAIYKGEGPRTLLSRMMLFKAFKEIAVGPPYYQIQGSEWSRMFMVSSQWYALYLRYARYDYQSGLQQMSWRYGKGHQILMEIVGDSRTLISEAIARHPDHVVGFSQLERLILGFKPDELPVQRETIRKFLVPLFTRILGGADGGSEGRSAVGLTQGAVNRLWEVVSRWSEGQSYLEEIYSKVASSRGMSSRPVDQLSFSPQELLKYSANGLIDPAKCSPTKSLLFSASDVHHEMDCLVAYSRSMLEPQDDQIFFGPQNDDYRISFFDLSQKNWARQLSRIFLAGYSNQKTLEQNQLGVNIEEFKIFVSDLLDVLVDIRALDKRFKDTAYLRRFREANLFVYSANGNGLMELDEVSDLLVFLVSTKKLAERMHYGIMKECGCILDNPKTPGGPQECKLDDNFGKPMVDASCYKTRFFNSFETYFDHMPGLASYYRSIDSTLRRSMQDALIRASRATRSGAAAPMDMGDSESLAGLIQYVEAIFSRFDVGKKHGDGTLQRDEAMQAYPVFKSELSKLAGVDSDSQLKAIFAYLLDNGKAPKADNIFEKLQFWFLWIVLSPDVNADREKLYQVFAQLAGGGLNNLKAVTSPNGTVTREPIAPVQQLPSGMPPFNRAQPLISPDQPAGRR